MNKKIIGIALIVILAIVFTGSYFVFGQPKQTVNTISNTPSPTPTSTLPNEKSTELAPIPKPSVPEFTVELIDSSYDVPTTYSIDPYTGENVTHTGYHVECRTIEVTIKNQPFVSYYDTSRNWTINFYYNIRIKGHYSEGWTELYRASDGYPTMWSDSEYTVISFQGDYSPTSGMEFTSQTIMTKFPSGGQVDFQVEAMIGYVHRTGEPPWFPWQFTGETSGWSETRTITIDITPPTISIVSPENKTYTVSNVSLTFNVSETTSWMAYSLDGQANVTITGNMTLAGLSDGMHSLVVYAKDTVGNTGASETIRFNIKTFPITWIVAAIAIIAVIGAALLVYFAKVKKTTGEVEK